MSIKFLLASLLTATICVNAKTENFSYDIVLTMVIIELIFSFGVGIACVVFSFNLYRAIKKDSEHFAPNNLQYQNNSKTTQNTKGGSDYRTFLEEGNSSAEAGRDSGGPTGPSRADYFSDEYEIDEETPGSVVSLMSNFGSFIRLW